MMIKALGQLLLAVSLFHAAPIDAAFLEAKVLNTEPVSPLAHLLLVPAKAHLPKAEMKSVPAPKKVDKNTYGVITSAGSVIVLDAASGATLYAERPDEVRPMGSITKLMTILVFFDTKPDLSKSVTLTEDDYVGGGRMFLNFDDPLTLKSVLGASIVGSDNTAAGSLVRFSNLTEEEFVQKMNEKAVALGLKQTHFVDPSGLSSENVSTARELAILLAAAKKEPVVKSFMTSKVLTVTQRSGYSVNVPTTNQLLDSAMNRGDYAIAGGKTGYIPQAGYCLAAAVRHEGNEVIVVVLGAEGKDDRFTDVGALAAWSFNTFVWPTL